MTNHEAAVATLVHYLRVMAKTRAYKRDKYDDPVNENGEYQSDPSPAADIARKICDELLEAAEADGHYGCRLCRS